MRLLMYSLKDPSLLFFNNKRSARRANFKKVYKIDQAPSDSGMRTILDEVSPLNFKGVFRGLVGRLRKAGIWEAYQYYRGHRLSGQKTSNAGDPRAHH